MTEEPQGRSRTVPPVGLLLSLGALAIPVVSAFHAPSWMEGDAAVLMWLTALLPAFVLTHYKGWRGVSTAIAGGMVLLTGSGGSRGFDEVTVVGARVEDAARAGDGEEVARWLEKLRDYLERVQVFPIHVE